MEPTFLAYRGGELLVEGVPLAALAAERETPFFLLGERAIRTAYARMTRAFATAGVAAEVRYCAKTNSEAAVLRTLAACGAGLLACHPAEVALARAAGFAAERIAYQKPVLTARDLDAVIGQGVGLIHVHFPADLALLAAAAQRAGRRLRLSLRLAPPRGLSPLRAASRRNGLSVDEALAVAGTVHPPAAAGQRRGANPRDWLQVVGINVYLGTQQRAPGGLARGAARALDLLRRLAALGVEIEEVNVGGGIPSPSLSRFTLQGLLPRLLDRQPALATGPGPAAAAEPDVDPFTFRLAQRFAALTRSLPKTARVPRLVVEPGRALVGGAGLLVSRVHAVRGRWLFLDASRDFLPESPWLLRRRILPAREPSAPARRFLHLSGGGLNTLDVLDLHRRLPAIDSGDLLVLCDAGAYSISRACRYTGLSPAVLLLAADGSTRLVRRAESLDDLMGPMLADADADVA